MVLEMLSDDVTALTLRLPDHVISFSPHELVGRRIYGWGDYDRARVEELIATLDSRGLLPSDGATVLEVGAHIGTQTVYFCKTDRVRRVVAVEPDPRNLVLLRRNIAENALSEIVRLAPCALGDRESTAELFRYERNHGGSSLIRGTHDGDSVQVDVMPLTRILAAAAVPEEEITLIWMDIEGAEPMALRSMTSLLARRVPVMLEYSPELYGEAGSADFVTFLSTYYEHCIHYVRGARSEMKVTELPHSGRQGDVLLLP